MAKARPATPRISRQFMPDTSTFEFGPLLAGKDRSGGAAAVLGRHPDHAAKLRITNSGLFGAQAEFWLKSQGSAPPGDSAAAPAGSDRPRSGAKRGSSITATSKGGAAALAAAAAATALKGPFMLHPTSMELGIGESRELAVVALPEAEGLVADVVMCRCGRRGGTKHTAGLAPAKLNSMLCNTKNLSCAMLNSLPFDLPLHAG